MIVFPAANPVSAASMNPPVIARRRAVSYPASRSGVAAARVVNSSETIAPLGNRRDRYGTDRYEQRLLAPAHHGAGDGKSHSQRPQMPRSARRAPKPA